MATNGDPMKQLVAAIAAYQEQQEMSDREMAEELGVPRSTWSAARLGHFAPGLKFAKTVARVARFRDVAQKALNA